MNNIDISSYLASYQLGIFPMGESRDDEIDTWVQPQMRGIIPLETFNIPRSLKKFMTSCDYTVTINQAFADVIHACASIPRDHESNTWITHDIEFAFNALHHHGHAHSIEVWDNQNNLIGGLYGLAQGGCFNGESMFSRAENASKIALVHLVERLKFKGFTLLDTQFVNDHLKQFGCIEIPHDDYMGKLNDTLEKNVTFI
jgi:leucyl/phenylalanyl-tRNA--protein transferase